MQPVTGFQVASVHSIAEPIGHTWGMMAGGAGEALESEARAALEAEEELVLAVRLAARDRVPEVHPELVLAAEDEVVERKLLHPYAFRVPILNREAVICFS